MRIVEKHRAVVGEKALRLRVEFEFGIAGDDDILLRAQAALDHSAAIFDPADQRQVEIAVALLISSFAIARPMLDENRARRKSGDAGEPGGGDFGRHENRAAREERKSVV